MRLNNPTDGPHFAYPCIHQWTLTLLPPPGHSEWCWWAVVDTQSCLHRCHHSQCFLPAPSPGDLPSTGLSDDTNAQAPSSQQWKQCWRREVFLNVYRYSLLLPCLYVQFIEYLLFPFYALRDEKEWDVIQKIVTKIKICRICFLNLGNKTKSGHIVFIFILSDNTKLIINLHFWYKFLFLI